MGRGLARVTALLQRACGEDCRATLEQNPWNSLPAVPGDGLGWHCSESPRSSAWDAQFPLHKGVGARGLLHPDVRSKQESVVSVLVVCESPGRRSDSNGGDAPAGSQMASCEQAVRPRNLLSERGDVTPSQHLGLGTGFCTVLSPCPEPVPCQHAQQQAARPGVAGAGGPGPGTGLPGVSSAKHHGERCCEMVAVPVPGRTGAGEPSCAGNSGVSVHILRVLQHWGVGGGAGASAARCTVQPGCPASGEGGFYVGLWRGPLPQPGTSRLGGDGEGRSSRFPEACKFGK